MEQPRSGERGALPGRRSGGRGPDQFVFRQDGLSASGPAHGPTRDEREVAGRVRERSGGDVALRHDAPDRQSARRRALHDRGWPNSPSSSDSRHGCPPRRRDGAEERMTPAEKFDRVVTAFARDRRLAPIAKAFRAEQQRPGSKKFGSSALKLKGKMFAMLVKGRLVVKLAPDRVSDLVKRGDAEYFDPGHGRL